MHVRAHGQGGGQALSECRSERKSLPPTLPLPRRAFPEAEPELGWLVERQELPERSRHVDGGNDTAAALLRRFLGDPLPAPRTIASILSPFGTDWTSVIRSGDSASRRATPRTVPVTVSPTSSRRTVKSWPAPSAAITVSPGLRRSTRLRWRDSARSKATRPSRIRSGAIVKRRTGELEGGPALHRHRCARSEPVTTERGGDAGRLRVEDAAEQERAPGSEIAGVARRQPEVRRGQEVGHDERRPRLLERARVAEDAAHAIADTVAGGIRHRGGDGVGIVVDGEDPADAEPRGGDCEHARAG